MPTNPTRSDLETAYKAALIPYFDVDCITTIIESDRGEFHIELCAFDEDKPLNVANLGDDLTAEDFADADGFDAIDDGPTYFMLASEGDDAAELVDEVLAVASAVDGELAGIQPKTVRGDPPWWLPGFLTPSRGRSA